MSGATTMTRTPRRRSRQLGTVAAAGAIIGSAALLASGCGSSPADTPAAIATAETARPGTSAGPEDATTATAAPTPSVAEGARPSAGCREVGATAATTAPSTEGTALVAEGPAHETIDVDGTSRRYDITFPTAPSAITSPAPLVLAFHGFSHNAAIFEELTNMAERGTAAGNVVVLPDGVGTPQTWEYSGTGKDGVFVEALIDHVAATNCIDLARVFLSGFSAGSAFTVGYACSHQDQVAAIATVAAEFVLGCAEPMSIVAFHGTNDPLVPYEDGAIGRSLPGVKVRGTELNIVDWANLATCGEPAKTAVGTRVTHWVFAGCTDAEVELFSIERGGHTWPGTGDIENEDRTQEVDATDEALAFFARQRR